MKNDFSGLDKLTQGLKQFEQTAKRADKEGIKFSELFTETFMRRYTRVSTFDEFLAAGNFEVNSQADFEAIPDDVFDEYVSSNTKFHSWAEMQEQATHEWLSKQLHF